MSEKATSKIIGVNFGWRFLERCGAQGVALIVQIVLARLLEPEDFGTIALVTVFTSILNVFVDSGLGNALIQKKDADDLDFSTVFYFNVGLCTILYLAMFMVSPLIAAFYNRPELTSIVRVLSLSLLISGVKNIQQAYVSRTMLFRRFFYATMGGTIGAACIGIVMAYRGFGVWALVAQQIFNASVDTLILWFTVKWHPRKQFSWLRLKSLVSFGWKLLASSLLNNVLGNIQQLVIGKMYTPTDLAQYNRGRQFPNVFIENINTSLDSVLFPVMSKVQDDINEVRNMTRRAIKVSCYIMSPFLFGLAFCAEPFVSLILGEKWLPSVPYMRIFCAIFVFYPVHTANLNAIKALGRSDLYLKLEVIKKVVGFATLLSTMWFGVIAMACGSLVVSVLNQIINSWPNKRLMNYSYLDQLKDVFPDLFLALFMGCCIYPVQWLGLSDFVTLLIQVLMGAVIYISGSKLLKLETFNYLWAMVKPMIFKVLKRCKLG